MNNYLLFFLFQRCRLVPERIMMHMCMFFLALSILILCFHFMFLGDLYQEPGTAGGERLNEVCLQLCIFIECFSININVNIIQHKHNAYLLSSALGVELLKQPQQ